MLEVGFRRRLFNAGRRLACLWMDALGVGMMLCSLLRLKKSITKSNLHTLNPKRKELGNFRVCHCCSSGIWVQLGASYEDFLSFHCMVPYPKPHLREDYVETIIFSCHLVLVEAEESKVFSWEILCSVSI